MIKDLLERSIRNSRGYVEMRYHKRDTFSVSVKDGEIDALNSGSVAGVCSRVLLEGSFGFSSTTVVEKENVDRMLKDAYSLARASRAKKKRRVRLANVEPARDEFETLVKVDPRKADRLELVRMVIDTNREIRASSKSIVSDTVRLGVVDDELLFVSSEGAEIGQRIVRCLGVVTAIAREGGNIASAVDYVGEEGGLEAFKKTPLIEAGKTAAERAAKLVKVETAPGGTYSVVLEDKIVGLLAHEAVGHCSEADSVYGGSFLADKIGKRVASEKVTLVDDGRFPGGFGTMKYDDEGTPTGKTAVIEKGVARSFLHSRETAEHFKVVPTGNARAWDFEFDPIIRMRNTYIEPGRYTLEELVEGVKEGFLLKGGLAGQADFNGEFMFGTQEAVRIRNGRLGESLRGVTISGNAFEVLKNTDAVGRDFAMQIGMCGKEQQNYVGMGGGSLRTKLLLGGMR